MSRSRSRSSCSERFVSCSSFILMACFAGHPEAWDGRPISLHATVPVMRSTTMVADCARDVGMLKIRRARCGVREIGKAPTALCILMRNKGFCALIRTERGASNEIFVASSHTDRDGSSDDGSAYSKSAGAQHAWNVAFVCVLVLFSPTVPQTGKGRDELGMPTLCRTVLRLPTSYRGKSTSF